MATTKQGIVRKAINDTLNLYDNGEFPAAALGFISQLQNNASTSWLVVSADKIKDELKQLMYFGSREELVMYLEIEFLQYV